MNKQKMLELADRLEKIPRKQFDIDSWASKFGESNSKVCPIDVGTCGTTCCIAGYQQVFAGHCVLGTYAYLDATLEERLGRVEYVAMDDLGLTYEQSERLFYGWKWPKKFSNGVYVQRFPRTPKGAAARIRYMVRTEQ